MKASRVQYFFAQNWPSKLWFAGICLSALVMAANACHPSWLALKDWHFLILFLVAIVIAPAFAFYLSLPATCLFITPIYWARAKLNGAPFHVGDRVQILVGPHRDTVAGIYSTWQGGTFRVELGSAAEKNYQDIFSAWQILKIDARPLERGL